VIALIDYGAGNLRSVEFALERLGVPHLRAGRPEDLEGADGIILPGVGAAANAMGELRGRGLAEPLTATRLPLLGVCLGMQLLTERSEEGAGVDCLGLVPGEVRRFGAEVRVPQIGWNSVDMATDPLFEGLGRCEHFYFLHSYRVVCPREAVIGTAEYGAPFPAAIRRDGHVGVQFHPEKSGPAGLRVLANFCGAARAW